MYYRVVALYHDAEVSEGTGATQAEAMADANEQAPSIYPLEDLRYETHTEDYSEDDDDEPDTSDERRAALMRQPGNPSEDLGFEDFGRNDWKLEPFA